VTAQPANDVESRDLSVLWKDPDGQVGSGLLLSDRIRFYVEKAKLIEPFSESHLSPAAYDLTLGNVCWYAGFAGKNGGPKRVLSDGETLVLPPNSIVFVDSAETLTLPFYLAGRFNLKLKFLHQGLLVGAGPQVDPGYVGSLSCPLHNVSNENVSIKCGQPFARIEFHKTTPFAQQHTWAGDTEVSNVRALGEAGKLAGLDGHPCITFPTRSLNRKPIQDYLFEGKLATSSVDHMATRVGEIEADISLKTKELRADIKTFNLSAYIALGVASLSFATYFWAVVNWTKSYQDAAIRAEEHVRVLEVQRGALESRVRDIEQKLAIQTGPKAVNGMPRSAIPRQPGLNGKASSGKK